jgi:transmembrane sensor
MESHSQIEDEAAEWLARRDSGHWADEDEAHLQQWIGASTARRIAYLRLKSTWDAAARLRALRAGTSPASSGEGVPPPGEWRGSPFFEQSAAPVPGPHLSEQLKLTTDPGTLLRLRDDTMPGASTPRRWHRNFSLAVAASISFLVVAGFSAYQFWGSGGERYTTAVGGFASVPMTDGSKVTLNTDSVIRVALTEHERRVELEQGEAFFEVAKDPARPFVVRAGKKRVIAVGTKFSVQHLDKDIRVLVTEGKVRVEDSDSPSTPKGPDTGTILTAGDIARADGSAVVVQKAPPPQVEEFLSWREGYLRFHETALADAVAEMNRYNTRKIFIEDPELAVIQISGTFRPTQSDAFVRVLQDGFSIQARNEGERITLTGGP